MYKEYNKSDITAKEAYVIELQKNGYKAQIVKAPADIKAEKDGQVWYYEVKMTTQSDKYFGGATMTEWKQALEDSDHYRFVIAIDLGDGTWDFREYTPSKLMEYSTIPPFKVYFNVSLTEEKPKKTQVKCCENVTKQFQ